MDNQLARGWTTSWPSGRKKVDNQLTHQHIYIYIYMHAVESKLGPKIAFLESKFGSNISFFGAFAFQKSSSFCRENEINNEHNKKTNITVLWVKTWSTLLRNILGPSFDSNLDQVLTQPFCIFPLQKMLKPPFLKVLSAKTESFKPTPKI